MMEEVVGAQVQSCNNNSTSRRTSHRSSHIVLDKTKEIPRVGDILILHFKRSHDHLTKFFILEVEVFFQASDSILKV